MADDENARNGLGEFRPQELTAVIYRAVSGPAGPRDWREADSCYHSEARLVRTGFDASGKRVRRVMNWTEYKATVDEMLARATFHEYELEQTSLRFGDIACIRSTYAFRFDGESESRSGRGLNLVNAVLFDDGWKILSVVWDNEHTEQTLPPI